jgi:hypothetical protein
MGFPKGLPEAFKLDIAEEIMKSHHSTMPLTDG